MGLRARLKWRVSRDKKGATGETFTFPVDGFWRSVCALKQPILLVKGGASLQVLAATEEAHELFGSRNATQISGVLRSGLDPHTWSRIQMAVTNPGVFLNELPVRIQSSETSVSALLTVSGLPEHPDGPAALLILKVDQDQHFQSWSRSSRELLSSLPHPCWVVDPAGNVVFSNAAFSDFPLEALRIDHPEEQADPAEAQRRRHIQAELEKLPAQVRNTDTLASQTLDLGADGRWRMLCFPLQSREDSGLVGVLALNIEPALPQQFSDSGGFLGQTELTHVLHVREAERTALAREVHDSLGQELTVLKLEMHRLHSLVIGSCSPPATVVEHFQSVRQQVDNLAKTARRIAFEMRQDLVTVKGLAHSVQELVVDLRNRMRLQIQLEVTPSWVEPEQGMARQMYRSVQEMLNNVSKHAKANRCLVRMGLDQHVYWLEVRDDGVGMPAVRNSRSIGLNSLKERAELYEGRVSVTTRPEVEGTLVRMELPERRKPQQHVAAR